jgi:ubiquinone/menaquinone biosynthesis C-methylase UbiE
VSKQKLAYNPERSSLISVDGIETWPIVSGRPVLSRDLPAPEVKNPEHISNEMPEEALAIIRETQGLVLNLSAGGSREKFDHVVEVEYAIFRHTDVVADAHALPFDDECFDAIVVMNAFEHYREPHKVAAELHRILKPDGRIHIRTAFLQPLHEKPWHFFNCTRYGLAEWFKSFETERLHVSKNFCPNHTVAWIASELEAAFRKEVSPAVADAFRSASIGELVDLWRDPSKRDTPLWTDFERLPQTDQDTTAAGFELIGRRPRDLPNLKA